MTDNRQRRNTPTGNGKLKEVLEAIRDFILHNSKVVFPVILIACVAFTVVIALNAGKKKDGSWYVLTAILWDLGNWTKAGSKTNITQAGVCSRRNYAA